MPEMQVGTREQGQDLEFTARMNARIVLSKAIVDDEAFDLDDYLEATFKESFQVLLEETSGISRLKG